MQLCIAEPEHDNQAVVLGGELKLSPFHLPAKRMYGCPDACQRIAEWRAVHECLFGKLYYLSFALPQPASEQLPAKRLGTLPCAVPVQ